MTSPAGWRPAGARRARRGCSICGRESGGSPPDGQFLVLSRSDMWTGPAVPALTAGESMTDIMNRTVYQSALGKQDFAFGLDAIHQPAAQAGSP